MEQTNQMERNESRRFETRPSYDFYMSMSKDGKYCIFKHVTTYIKPVKWVETIMSGPRPEFLNGEESISEEEFNDFTQ